MCVPRCGPARIVREGHERSHQNKCVLCPPRTRNRAASVSVDLNHTPRPENPQHSVSGVLPSHLPALSAGRAAMFDIALAGS